MVRDLSVVQGFRGTKNISLETKLRGQRGRHRGKDAVDLAEGGGLGVEMGGVGLSEFKDVIKHTIPQVFVSVVAKIIRPRSMQINLGPPEDNRQLIIWGEVKIAEEKRNKSVRGGDIPSFHPIDFLSNFANMVPIHPIVVSIQNFKAPIRGGRSMRRWDKLSTTKLT